MAADTSQEEARGLAAGTDGGWQGRWHRSRSEQFAEALRAVWHTGHAAVVKSPGGNAELAQGRLAAATRLPIPAIESRGTERADLSDARSLS